MKFVKFLSLHGVMSIENNKRELRTQVPGTTERLPYSTRMRCAAKKSGGRSGHWRGVAHNDCRTRRIT